MAKPDKVFRQTCAWYEASIDHVLDASEIPPVDRQAVRELIWQTLGLLDPTVAPINSDLNDFSANVAAPESLAIACQFIGESLTALGFIKTAVDGLEEGSPAEALSVIRPVMQQIDNLKKSPETSRYPSAFSIGKILLMLSGDAQASPPTGHEADKLAVLLGATSPAAVANAQAALGIVSLLVGSMLDHSFTAPMQAAASAFITQTIPPFVGKPTLALHGPGGVTGTLDFDTGAPGAIRAALDLEFGRSQPIDGTNIALNLSAGGYIDLLIPLDSAGNVKVSRDCQIELDLRRKGKALTIGGRGSQPRLSIDELGVGLKLANGKPSLQFIVKGNVALMPPDGLLRLVLGDGISVAFDVTAQADAAGKLRLINGNGLHASLPIPTLPTGPFELQLVNLELDPKEGSFSKLSAEISASFGVAIGPFAGTVDRLGIVLKLDSESGKPPSFGIKQPDGIGLSLDAGIIKGGGYLVKTGEQGYSGFLDLKLLAVDIKAVALLETDRSIGFSLLLLVFGQFPAIQLSFGFTLTGMGGLIGVQHTVSPSALSDALSAGRLDAVLFPANPGANAPQIINALRPMFPPKSGGFIIGPMLELGWGTPSLVTVRLALLIEADQFTLLGQTIIALPPRVPADLALLYLRLDFMGSVVFSPLRIAFDAKLIHSRVAMMPITGQFAFRAAFGDRPTFIMSAGGFHPHFKEVPADIPSPFDRVGMSLRIGSVGISFKGYFAITSATVQAGAELRAWADLGIAKIEGGLGFDAICWLEPRFYFEVDIFAYLSVHTLIGDFASIRLDGALSGPGRWHLTGTARIETFLKDVPIHIDEHFGTDPATPQDTVDVADLLGKEIVKTGNWSAQLPTGGDGYLSLAKVDAGADLLAHPLGSLTFQQKLVPLGLKLDKASGSRITGANEFSDGELKLPQDGNPVPVDTVAAQPLKDFFAAAQFLDMSQDDKLTRPSFESFIAGYQLASEDFEMGEIIPELLDYEEADLGASPEPGIGLRLAKDLYVESVHSAALMFGAAGRSPLRDRTLARPEEMTALKVNPVPITVADKATLAPAADGRTFTSVWCATQARAAVKHVDVARVHVAELAELTA